MKIFFYIAIFLTGVVHSQITLSTKKSFPSFFGRGEEIMEGGNITGKIFYVTTLSPNSTSKTYDAGTDSYTGSFREAIKHNGDLVILFRVSGMIDFSGLGNGANLYLEGNSFGNKTIIGASAPFPGIFIYGTRGHWSGGNWIVRGLTWLMGDNLVGGNPFVLRDNVIISDCSFGWGQDEAMFLRGSTYIGVQRNVIVEGRKETDKAGVIGTPNDIGFQTHEVSIHNNVSYVGYRVFNPNGSSSDHYDQVNNIAYYDNGTRTLSMSGPLNINFISEQFIHRDNVSLGSVSHMWNAGQGSGGWGGPWTPPQIYSYNTLFKDQKGAVTIFDGDEGAGNEQTLFRQHITANGYVAGDALPGSFFTGTVHALGSSLSGIVSDDHDEIFQRNVVNKNVGSRYYTDENGVRQKYIFPTIDEYLNDINNQTEVAFRDVSYSGFVKPTLPSSGTAYTDTGNWGIANSFRTEHSITSATQVITNWTIDGRTITNTAGYTAREMFWAYISGCFEILAILPGVGGEEVPVAGEEINETSGMLISH